jgi:hypothetical protein
MKNLLLTWKIAVGDAAFSFCSLFGTKTVSMLHSDLI